MCSCFSAPFAQKKNLLSAGYVYTQTRANDQIVPALLKQIHSLLHVNKIHFADLFSLFPHLLVHKSVTFPSVRKQFLNSMSTN